MSDSHEPSVSQAGCMAKHCREQPEEKLIHVIDFSPTHWESEESLVMRPGRLSDICKIHASCLSQISHPEGICRWIHIPVNDVEVAEKCVKRLMGEAASRVLRDEWTQKLRPAISDSPVTVPDHAWSMEPSFQTFKASRHSEDELRLPESSRGYSLFLPYLNWKHFHEIKNKGRNRPKEPKVRHQRRTLDEFYHSGLQNMELRNAGQTVSKWTGQGEDPIPANGRTKAVDDSLVTMADQLWVWALNEYTLVSCFPTDEPLRKPDEGIFPNADDLDVMASAIKVDDLEKCRSTVDLLVLLACRSIDRLFEESTGGFVDLLSIYRWAAANKAARHTELLEEFTIRQSDNSTGDLANEGAKELNLMLEVVDILDELNMLILLFEKQTSVASALSEVGSGIFGLKEEVTNRLTARQADTGRLRIEVTQTHDLLLELLDLEQKAASLGEARVTTKQGQAVMLFTIITIIFLPLSFFTSYFGQNVVDFTGDDKNPKASEVWKVGAPISVVVIVVAITIAVIIMSPWKQISFWWQKQVGVFRNARARWRRYRQRARPQNDIPLDDV